MPLPDFGGGHPDPNPIWAEAADRPDDGRRTRPISAAASDGDGDRNMIVGRGAYVTPSDSLAVLAANAHLAPGYAGGLTGVARSMPTSRAVDRVAAAWASNATRRRRAGSSSATFSTPGASTLCGEESAGTGSDHVREKDGLWAVLLWLNILADTASRCRSSCADHWAEYGRNYYSRHDYEAVETGRPKPVMDRLRGALRRSAGAEVAGLTVEAADEFAYDDPVDGSRQRRRRACGSASTAARASCSGCRAPGRWARRCGSTTRRSRRTRRA